MDKREQAQLDMRRSVRDTLRNAEFSAIINGIADIKDGVDALAASITVTETLDLERAGAAKGDGGTKKKARTELISSAFAVDGMITAYAAKKDLPDLLKMVAHEKSDFVRMGDEDLRTTSQFLLNKAKELDALADKPLGGAGLTTLKLQTFDSRMNLYAAVINRPANLAQHESTIVKLIDAEFEKSGRLLELILDRLMQQYEEENPRLYAAYWEARTINDPASRPRKTNGATTGGASGAATATAGGTAGK